MRELLEPLDRWLSEGRPLVLIRAIQVTGFGAGQYDNCQILTADGQRAGQLFAGLPDRDVATAAADVFANGTAALVEFRIGDAEAAAGGLSCGGRATLLIEPVHSVPSGQSVPSGLWEAVRSGETFALASPIDRPATLVVRPNGVAGTLGDGALDARATALARELLSDSRKNRLDGDGLAVDKVTPRTKVMAIGGGEVVQALADLTAALGWLYATQVEGDSAVASAAALSAADALVVTTHHPQWGPACLAAALKSSAFFVGALGSRGTQKHRAETLLAGGTSEADIARIHGPVGLDLGGRTPAETALAICAEVLAVRAGRDLASLADRGGPING